MPGSVVGHYEVQGLLGRGAYGTVYLGRDPLLDRRVAIKELSPALSGDPRMLDWFRAEAHTMASLDHPNCVRVYDFLQVQDRAFLVSEYVFGNTLRRVIETTGRLSPQQALGVVKGALKGLEHAHSLGIVHRDFKPDNVLVDQEGTSKLADFGQAVVGVDGTSRGPSGTPAYMSPEQVSGGPVDRRSDLYSAGVVLFEMLTSRLPFVADSAAAVMHMQVDTPPPDPRGYNTDLHGSVSALLVRALAKEPTARFQDAAEFLAGLEATAVEAYGREWEQAAGIKALVAATAAVAVQAIVPTGNSAPVAVPTRVGVARKIRGFVNVGLASALLGLGLLLLPGSHGLLFDAAIALLLYGILGIISGIRIARYARGTRMPFKTLGSVVKWSVVTMSIVGVLAGGGTVLAEVQRQDALRSAAYAKQQDAKMKQFDQQFKALLQQAANSDHTCHDPGHPNYNASDHGCYTPCQAGETFAPGTPPKCVGPPQPAPQRGTYEGIYDFHETAANGPVTVPGEWHVTNGVVSSPDGQFTGTVNRSTGAVTVDGPCPVNGGRATFTGTLNNTSGYGTATCLRPAGNGITFPWSVSNGR